MGKSKVHMPKELEKKCHIAIHSATTARRSSRSNTDSYVRCNTDHSGTGCNDYIIRKSFWNFIITIGSKKYC